MRFKEETYMALSLKKTLAAAIVFVLAISAFLPVVPWNESVNAEAVEYLPFTVVFTGGMHGNVEPFNYKGEANYGGYAKARTKIDDIREELTNDRTWWPYGGNTLVLDAGNSIMGSKTGFLFVDKNLEDVHPTIRAMNKIAYDAKLYGASEFAINPSIREKLKTKSDFPWITANVVVGKERKKLSDEYIMKVYKIPTAAHPLRYGVVGLTNPAVFSWENPTNLKLGSSSLELENYVDKAQEHAETLKETGEKADFIVVLTDLGLEKNSDGTWKENALYQAIQDITHIDFVCSTSPGLAVQQEIFLVPERGGALHETLFCQLPEDGITLGRMDFVLEKCTCPVKPYVFRKINGRRQMKSRFSVLNQEITPDAEIMNDFKSSKNVMNQEYSLKIGEVTCAIDSKLARLQDSELVEMACDVMLAETSADIAMTDIWTTSARIEKGMFTEGDLFELYPKDAKIYTIELTGQQIKNALAHAASVYNTEGDVNFIVAKGIDYYIDIREGKDPVGYIKMNGNDLSMSKTYTVATHSYIALGQGGYDFSGAKVTETRKDLRTSIKNYIRKNNSSWPCKKSKNWFVVPDYLHHWSYDYVDVLMEKSIVAGDQFGRYSPDNYITRAAAAVMCLNIYDHPQAKPAKGTFADVPSSHWAYPYIEGGVAKGMWFWLSGNFGPNANATREDIMVNMVLSSGDKAKAEAMTAAEMAEFEKNFLDANDCSDYAKKYVAYATKIGLVSGYAADDGKFTIKPKNNIRRSEVATLMAKARFPVVALMGTADYRTELDTWRIDPDNDRPVGGAMGLAYTIGNMRGLYAANILVDAGGFAQGSAWAELGDGKVSTGLINTLGYDAITFGSKEFYHGAADIAKQVTEITPPVLGANVTGLAGVEKSVLKDVGGIKVGIVGAMNPDTSKFVCEGEMGEVVITEMAKAINTEASALKSKGAEIIVAIAPAGGYIELGKTAEEGFKGPASVLANALNGVNVLFVSGSPQAFVAPANGLWVVGPGEGASSVGLAKVTFDTKNRTIDKVIGINEYTLNKPETVRTQATELWTAVESFLKTARAAVKGEYDRVVAKTETGLNYDSANECRLGDVITSSIAEQLGADIVLYPSDHAWEGFAPGNITLGGVYNVLPYEDVWVTGKVLGRDLYKICESSVSGERGQLQTHGMVFIFSRSSEPGNRVSEVHIGKGYKFTPDEEYRTLVKNNSKDEYVVAIPAREYYTLPTFGHEILSEKMSDVSSSCVYVRKAFIDYLTKMTEAGQAVNQEIEDRYKEP